MNQYKVSVAKKELNIFFILNPTGTNQQYNFFKFVKFINSKSELGQNDIESKGKSKLSEFSELPPLRLIDPNWVLRHFKLPS